MKKFWDEVLFTEPNLVRPCLMNHDESEYHLITKLMSCDFTFSIIVQTSSYILQHFYCRTCYMHATEQVLYLLHVFFLYKFPNVFLNFQMFLSFQMFQNFFSHKTNDSCLQVVFKFFALVQTLSGRSRRDLLLSSHYRIAMERAATSLAVGQNRPNRTSLGHVPSY